ncbi:MAG: ABC transporter ATP-binding protein [Chloroflexota bacterium]|jgi:lipopolysaccharide transport system ATP-binding protein
MNPSSNGHYPSDVAIIVENLGKQYHIGLQEKKQDTLMQTALAWIASPVNNLRRLRRLSEVDDEDSEDVIWALRDVSFTINQGEVVGIIGRNGAGKSTLLKILSRITPPTTGKVILNGRVSSLLEVGTGFHPELTGRENVYLNGTILGMTRSEVARKFDEIVAFAEVEKFIDTPIKRYSSGMRVRLAFAVSAYLESEILLVDEVLAVGDAAFQEKCLSVMDSVAKVGRTVFLVSHNMQVIQRLCSRVLLFEGGRLNAEGSPSSTVNRYLNESLLESTRNSIQLGYELRINELDVYQNGTPVGKILDSSQAFEIQVHYEILHPLRNLLLGFNVVAGDGTNLFRTYDMVDYGMGDRMPGPYQSVFQLPGRTFASGFYFFELFVGIHRVRWFSKGDIRLRLNLDEVRETDIDFPGVFSPIGTWKVRYGEQS